MCKELKVNKISEDTIYISTGFGEWIAERCRNGYSLEHVNQQSNRKNKYRTHKQDKTFEDLESVYSYVKKHDYRLFIPRMRS